MLNKNTDALQCAMARCVKLLALLAFVGGLVFSGGTIAAKEGAWQQAYKLRARLITGGTDKKDDATRLAFVQLELEPGWKTYWRHPGEAGGIPPEFLLEGSSNLKAVDVLYPAPLRMSEDLGDTIGYKKSVIFPMRLTPQEVTQPINLNVAFRFGICKDICVPSEANFKLEVPVGKTKSLPLEFLAALAAVPRNRDSLKPSDPVLQSVNAPQKDGDFWKIGLTTKHKNDAKDADLFLEAPAGLFIPVPKRKVQGSDGSQRAPTRMGYEIRVTDSEFQALKGKTLRATVIDGLGASQSEFVLR